MSQTGIGALLHMLGGGSEQSAEKYIGRTITAAALADERLNLAFSDGARIAIFDNGQSCCESRYVTTDDDVASLVGHKLVRIEAKDGPETGEEWGETHESCFVEIGTDDGFVTLTNHNEHNGYYGGFGLTIVEVNGSSND